MSFLSPASNVKTENESDQFKKEITIIRMKNLVACIKQEIKFSKLPQSRHQKKILPYCNDCTLRF
jgi:hypothetical protein